MVIGSTERSYSIDVPLTKSVKNTRPEVVKLAKTAKNSGIRDRTFERKVIESSEILENDFGGVRACSCSLNTCDRNQSTVGAGMSKKGLFKTNICFLAFVGMLIEI